MPAIRIAVDERERSSGIPELLKRAGALIDFAMLPVGDYIVSHDTAVERKTVRDLISSIYDGRLYLQCSDLVKHYERPIMVIQGNLAELDEIPDDIEEKDTRRLAERTPLAYDALATVAIEFRIPIIHSPSARHTAQLLVTLVNKSLREGKTSGPLLRKIKKENPVYVQQLSVLSSVPGIGDKLAIRMLDRFKTPSKALSATAADLAKIPGFGISRAERVRRILDSASSQSTPVQSTLFDAEV
ncbi:MAG: ERCC4 domain-containing protein [Nitrososphaera sp.]